MLASSTEPAHDVLVEPFAWPSAAMQALRDWP
jgi:hypothetical protein